LDNYIKVSVPSSMLSTFRTKTQFLNLDQEERILLIQETQHHCHLNMFGQICPQPYLSFLYNIAFYLFYVHKLNIMSLLDILLFLLK